VIKQGHYVILLKARVVLNNNENKIKHQWN